jgi:hypothetical protein
MHEQLKRESGWANPRAFVTSVQVEKEKRKRDSGGDSDNVRAVRKETERETERDGKVRDDDMSMQPVSGSPY